MQAAIPGSTVHVGGEVFSVDMPHLSVVEGIGVVVAIIVLILVLGSFRAAIMPIVNALVGAAASMLVIVAAAGIMPINSTTTMLALMLALAVGIDYSLFIVSRHRDQLATGMDAEESAARATATAGSAVVFAGLTVVIALVGLSIAGIPFLTTMGVFAAVAVAIEVALALTLLPAMLGFAGARLTPKPVKNPDKKRFDASRWWVGVITKVPAVTVVAVIALLGAWMLAYYAVEAVATRVPSSIGGTMWGLFFLINMVSGMLIRFVMRKLGMTYRYSYEELWQPKNFPVIFRMYQLNLNGDNEFVYRKYWDEATNHFVEDL